MPEKLTAYEIGLRAQPGTRLSLSVSAFYNVYDDLRTIEFSPGPSFPLLWGNGIRGDTYGLEAWGDLQAAPWWRLSAGVDLLAKQLTAKPGSSGILPVSPGRRRSADPGAAALGDEPRLTRHLDADLRYVAALPDPRVPAYAEADVALTWAVTRHLELALAGFNLLHAQHLEFAAPQATEVPRVGQAELKWRF